MAACLLRVILGLLSYTTDDFMDYLKLLPVAINLEKHIIYETSS